MLFFHLYHNYNTVSLDQSASFFHLSHVLKKCKNIPITSFNLTTQDSSYQSVDDVEVKQNITALTFKRPKFFFVVVVCSLFVFPLFSDWFFCSLTGSFVLKCPIHRTLDVKGLIRVMSCQ